MSMKQSRWYRGVIIDPPNYCGMWSARVTVPGGGVRLAADTLAGVKYLITLELHKQGLTREPL
jgi:hypothetical protein